MKANCTLASRQILSDEGAGADVYSEGELLGALKCGTQPELISVNGGGKNEAFIRKCIQAGVRITVEDLDEPELINRVAQKLGIKAKIRFRRIGFLPRSLIAALPLGLFDHLVRGATVGAVDHHGAGLDGDALLLQLGAAFPAL